MNKREDLYNRLRYMESENCLNINSLAGILQNPVTPNNETLINFTKLILILGADARELYDDVMKFIYSDEHLECIKFYEGFDKKEITIE